MLLLLIRHYTEDLEDFILVMEAEKILNLSLKS